jgi:cytidylate kinase
VTARPRGIVIAIDGPSGAGKSTTARAVAKRLAYDYLDTGAMYRAITLAALRAGVEPAEGLPLDALLARLRLEISTVGEGARFLLDGEDVTAAIRDPSVTARVSAFSALRAVRAALVQRQRAIAAGGGAVVEGRDIGTVVFPDAELKVFLDANLAERARRRRADLALAGHAATDDDVGVDLARRDAADSGRAHSPLAPAADAVRLDTSGLTFDAQVERIVRLARERGA